MATLAAYQRLLTAPCIGNHGLWRLRYEQGFGVTNCRRRSRTSYTASARTDGDRVAHQRIPTPRCGFSRILTDEQRALFHQVNQLSEFSKSLAKKVGNVAVMEDSILLDIARLQTHRRQRQQYPEQQRQSMNELADASTPPSLFTVVFAGEFNSGKSTLINALLGSEILETGVLPTTGGITMIMADGGDAASKNENKATPAVGEISSLCDADRTNMLVQTHLHLLSAAKFPILADLCLIDTPGTNAILSLQHTNLTLRILHDADLIIFVTSADRPFSESEQNLLRTSIKSYRKRVVLVINKMDVLERQMGEDHGEATKKRVLEYVVEHAGDLLGAQPIVIPLSARDALSTKLLYSSHDTTNNSADGRDYQSNLWNRSNLGALEQYLLKTLTASSKVKTKLINPIGVAEGILADCRKEIRRRQEELEVDIATLRLLKNQTDAWEKDLQTEVIEKCQLDIRGAMEDRAGMALRVIDELSFFEQWKLGMGLGGGTFWAKQRGRVGTKYTLEDELFAIVSDCMTTLTSRATKQGVDSLDYLGKRPVILGASIDGRGTRMVGSVRSPSFRRLKGLELSMADIIRTSISDFPSDETISTQIYTSLRRTAVLSNALVGSGVAIAALSACDVVAATSGATLSVFGGVILPLGNRYLASSLKRGLMLNAHRLESSLKGLLMDARLVVRSELSDSTAPYSQYVDSTGTWLQELSDQLDSAISSSHSLRNKINKLCQ